MSYLEELLPEFRNGAKIRRKYWGDNDFVEISDFKKGLIFTNKELEASDWEFYQEPIDWELYQNSVDWNYIIKIDAFAGFGMTKIMKILLPDWKLLIWMTIICALKAKTALRGEIVALSAEM